MPRITIKYCYSIKHSLQSSNSVRAAQCKMQAHQLEIFNFLQRHMFEIFVIFFIYIDAVTHADATYHGTMLPQTTLLYCDDLIINFISTYTLQSLP